MIGADDLPRDWFAELSKYGELIFIDDLLQNEIKKILPSIDCLIFHRWPNILDSKKISKMENLKVIQTMIGGVDSIPFKELVSGVKVYNNLGAYAVEVAEHAFALLLAAAKSIVRFDTALKSNSSVDFSSISRSKGIKTLKGATLGVIGYGNIGKVTGNYAKAFGMNVSAYVRRRHRKTNVKFYLGKSGLHEMLKTCDAFILALPLTKSTNGFIGHKELSAMKHDAILVNVGRGELVDASALYDKLIGSPSFTYATDVWWHKSRKESFSPDLPFFTLPNFIGTPHVSGPSATLSGRMPKIAVENLVTYLKGKTPRNAVDVRKLRA